MLNQNKYFRKFLDKKETGSLLVGAAIVSAVVGTIMVGVFSSGLIALKQSSYQVDESEFHLLNQKGLSLASYLISNNVILCRKEGWSTKNKKCVWGGKYHDPKLVQSQFKISNDGYDAANKYYIKVTIAPETVTTVYFDLANWEEDDNWSSLVGSVDDDSLAADDDKDMVVLTTIT